MAKGMSKGTPKTMAALPKAALPKTTGTAPAAGAPKTTASINAAPKAPAQKLAANAQPAAADPVGDICLLPDIARFAH